MQCVSKSIIIYAKGAVEMEEKELLRAIRQIVQEENEPIKKEIATMDGKIDRLREDSEITRSGVNTLLDWAEKVQVQVSIPLYRKDSD
mgnify:CR=1 FL=1